MDWELRESPPPTASKTVVNLSHVLLDAAARLTLSKGLSYTVNPVVLPTEDICGVVKAVCFLCDKDAEEVWQETITILKRTSKLKNNLTKVEI
jgi:hypothetical protein